MTQSHCKQQQPLPGALQGGHSPWELPPGQDCPALPSLVFSDTQITEVRLGLHFPGNPSKLFSPLYSLVLNGSPEGLFQQSQNCCCCCFVTISQLCELLSCLKEHIPEVLSGIRARAAFPRAPAASSLGKQTPRVALELQIQLSGVISGINLMSL